jgi:hypothetical protein
LNKRFEHLVADYPSATSLGDGNVDLGVAGWKGAPQLVMLPPEMVQAETDLPAKLTTYAVPALIAMPLGTFSADPPVGA